ncbi:FkbM family methyltransferase [Granulosicoccus sp. 3-233]|uniref:FkbM family methyltransferase n=1 Tax=Granulosicoccus sp. 3-233 TaxID=3417969 RepID=UPI003D32C960
MKTLHRLTTGNKLGSLIDRKMVKYLNRRAARNRQFRGTRMAIFANEHVGIQINQYGVYERQELMVLFDFLKPVEDAFARATVIDAGANIGNHSLFFSHYFQQVVAFEPNPSTCRLLAFNTEQVDNISIVNQGLGDEQGTLLLVEDSMNMGASSIVRKAGADERQIPVQIETLDRATADIDCIEMIKIDVEGFEINVLTGASGLIARHQPIIVFEQHAGEFHDGSTESLRFLSDRGYRFCWHQKGSAMRVRALSNLVNIREYFIGVRHRIVYDEKVPEKNHSMLIAVPERYSRQLLA